MFNCFISNTNIESRHLDFSLSTVFYGICVSQSFRGRLPGAPFLQR